MINWRKGEILQTKAGHSYLAARELDGYTPISISDFLPIGNAPAFEFSMYQGAVSPPERRQRFETAGR